MKFTVIYFAKISYKQWELALVERWRKKIVVKIVKMP